MHEHQFSGPVTVFQERRLPERATPAGYSALIDAYGLAVPLPRTSVRYRRAPPDHRTGRGWRIMTPRHAPHPTLEGHLTFALKVRGPRPRRPQAAVPDDRARRSRSARARKPDGKLRTPHLVSLRVADRHAPGSPRRRGWPLRPRRRSRAAMGGCRGETAPRHRVKNNLPGTPDFCPLVFRTETLERLHRPRPAAARAGHRRRCTARLLARTAAFLLLKDSKVELRDRRRASAAGPHPAMGPRHWRSRPPAARSRRAAAPAKDRHRRCPLCEARFPRRTAASSASMTAKPARPSPTISAQDRTTCPPLSTV